MRDQLPGLDAESEAGRRDRAPSGGHFRCRGIVECRLYFDHWKLGEVSRLRSGPAATSNQRQHIELLAGLRPNMPVPKLTMGCWSASYLTPVLWMRFVLTWIETEKRNSDMVGLLWQGR